MTTLTSLFPLEMQYIILFLFLPFCLKAQNDEAEIKALIQNSFDDIFSNYDKSKLETYYTNDFLLLENGEIWTIDTVKNYLERRNKVTDKPSRTNSFDFIKIEINGDLAWVAYHNYAIISKNEKQLAKLYWLESGDLIKTKDGWRMKLLHSTRVPINEE